MKTIKAFTGLVAVVFLLPLLSFVAGWAVIITGPFVLVIGGVTVLSAISAANILERMTIHREVPTSLPEEKFHTMTERTAEYISEVMALPFASFVFGWLAIILLPFALIAGGIVILSAIAADRIIRGMAALLHVPAGLVREAEILGMRGVPEHLNTTFKYELLNVLRYSPERKENKACFCIKKGGKDYFGILRIGSRDGNFIQKIHGGTREEVVQKYFEKFHEYRMHYPLVKGKKLRLIETKDCNKQVCPFKSLERFSMREAMLSTKRLKVA